MLAILNNLVIGLLCWRGHLIVARVRGFDAAHLTAALGLATMRPQ